MHKLKGFTPILILIIVAGLAAVATGGYFVYKNYASRATTQTEQAGQSASSAVSIITVPAVPVVNLGNGKEENQTQPISAKEVVIPKNGNQKGLCIDVFNFQTDLPLDHFSFSTPEEFTGLYKDGKEYILIYPLIAGLNVVQEYHLGNPVFIAKNSGWKVYTTEDAKGAGYIVAAPLPFIVMAQTSDAGIKTDTELFLNSIRPHSICSNPNPGLKKSETLEGWVVTLSTEPKEIIETAYTLYDYRYRTKITNNFMSYYRCNQYLVELAISKLSPAEKTSFVSAVRSLEVSQGFPPSSEGKIFGNELPGWNEAAHLLASDYIQPLLYQKFGKGYILQNDSSVSNEELNGPSDPSKEACKDLPIPQKYK